MRMILSVSNVNSTIRNEVGILYRKFMNLPPRHCWKRGLGPMIYGYGGASGFI